MGQPHPKTSRAGSPFGCFYVSDAYLHRGRWRTKILRMPPDCSCKLATVGSDIKYLYYNQLHTEAEEEGFEPPVRFPVQRFSRPPVSTTHPFLRFVTVAMWELRRKRSIVRQRRR